MTTVVLTMFLAAGIIVSCINVATILSGNGWRRPRWMRTEPEHTLVRTPEAVVAVARARAAAAATAQRVPLVQREQIALPAGPSLTLVASPSPEASSVTLDQVRYLVDDLVANDPDQLAQIITDWINEVPDKDRYSWNDRGTDRGNLSGR
jgi:hypothetical protein